jgi:hypothetical protein
MYVQAFELAAQSGWREICFEAATFSWLQGTAAEIKGNSAK